MTKKLVKTADEASELKRVGGAAYGLLQGLGSAALGAGTGFVARARYEDKFKTEREKTLKDKLLRKAPLIGGLAGFGGGFATGYRQVGRLLDNLVEVQDAIYSTWFKTTDEKTRNIIKKMFEITGKEKTKAEVRKKYLELAKKYHPDVNKNPNAAEQMRVVTEAWDKLQTSPWFEKLAGLKTTVDLMDHQKRFIDRLQENDGVMMAAHATGSGKTLSAIAGFEKLKKDSKAKRAIVVVPASLRDNFVQNLKRYTNSSFTVYGPKSEASSKSIGDRSTSDYNIISYELFRDHGEKLINDTGADTIIMDEIHKARGTEGVTYNKLRDLRPKFRNAITLTGSIVNNEPNEVVPLLDVTHTPTGHKLVSKNFFDKLFVKKDAVTRGIFTPKVHVEKSLKNKPQLANYLRGKIDYVSHEDLEKNMPRRELHVEEVPMSDDQLKIYNYSLNSVDPITRWKIKNNLPVSQKDAKDAFTQLMQARQVSTDHGIMDERLKDKNPYDYSPKVKKVVDDATSHLDEHKDNKTVIYGNLIKGQVESIEKALKAKGLPYAKFLGLGQEGMTNKSRPKEISDFQSGKKRILLLSGAGAEGLDLKNTTMLQMLEGHYNPERIQQAESRVRRIGSFAHLPEEDRKVKIVRYLSVPKPSGFLQKLYSSAGFAGDTGVDDWIYTIAKRKENLNRDFRETLDRNHVKKAHIPGFDEPGEMPFTPERSDELRVHMIGDFFGALPARIIAKRNQKEVERIAKQKLLDRNKDHLTDKRHLAKVMAETKIDERGIDTSVGVNMIGYGAGILNAINPTARKITKPLNYVSERVIVRPGIALADKFMPGLKNRPGLAKELAPYATSAMMGLTFPSLAQIAKGKIQRAALSGRDDDFDRGIANYQKKLKNKEDRKYKSSKSFVQEYETKKDLGINEYE